MSDKNSSMSQNGMFSNLAQINLRLKHLHSMNSKDNFLKWSELPGNWF
jgi:hypothetical protein